MSIEMGVSSFQFLTSEGGQISLLMHIAISLKLV